MRSSRFFPLVCFMAASLFVDPATGRAADDPPPLATTSVTLDRGAYAARFYDAASTPEKPVRGLVVFGSGDGGWSYWEERVCRHLAAAGFAVAGVDFRAYAEHDFSAPILRRDYRVLVDELRRRLPGSERLPLLYGGWSMGAEHALPAAAEPAERPPGLRGFILVAPGARGRFGLHLSDRIGIAPKGDNTFALRDLAPKSADLRFAVFHGGFDPLDDLEWFKGLGLDLRRWDVPRVFHDFGNAGPAFLAALDEALVWLLAPPAPAPAPGNAPGRPAPGQPGTHAPENPASPSPAP